jgi:hypothetical protein
MIFEQRAANSEQRIANSFFFKKAAFQLCVRESLPLAA